MGDCGNCKGTGRVRVNMFLGLHRSISCSACGGSGYSRKVNSSSYPNNHQASDEMTGINTTAVIPSSGDHSPYAPIKESFDGHGGTFGGAGASGDFGGDSSSCPSDSGGGGGGGD